MLYEMAVALSSRRRTAEDTAHRSVDRVAGKKSFPGRRSDWTLRDCTLGSQLAVAWHTAGTPAAEDVVVLGLVVEVGPAGAARRSESECAVEKK